MFRNKNFLYPLESIFYEGIGKCNIKFLDRFTYEDMFIKEIKSSTIDDIQDTRDTKVIEYIFEDQMNNYFIKLMKKTEEILRTR